jgi:hypothetical protein
VEVSRPEHAVGVRCRPLAFATVITAPASWPWRKRPRLLTASAISPAATDGSLTPRCLGLCNRPQFPLERPGWPSDFDSEVCNDALKALRVAPPALRAAGGLDRIVRKPCCA